MNPIFEKEDRPKIYCLTPVKNEEWIIEKFLKAASIWADEIIISDQGSTDKTVDIARSFPKVTLIDNSNLKEFDEKAMRTPLFDEARKYNGRKILISLDADEMFTPNFDSKEWDTIFNAPDGTVLRFDWLHIQPNFQSVLSHIDNPCGLVDDGTEYDVGLIHVPRQPIRSDVLNIKFNDIKILHFQFTNWERMERKHIWYQMYERIFHPQKSGVDIFRAFHYEKNTPLNSWTNKFEFNEEWINLYSVYGIDITSVNLIPVYHWDITIANYINQYGMSYFHKIEMGKYDLSNCECILGEKYESNKFKGKVYVFDKFIKLYLLRTNRYKSNIFIKIIDSILKQIW